MTTAFRELPAKLLGEILRGMFGLLEPAGDSSVFAVPQAWHCRLTRRPMFDPVLALDQCLYERKATEDWLTTSSHSPCALLPMGGS